MRQLVPQVRFCESTGGAGERTFPLQGAPHDEQNSRVCGSWYRRYGFAIPQAARVGRRPLDKSAAYSACSEYVFRSTINLLPFPGSDCASSLCPSLSAAVLHRYSPIPVDFLSRRPLYPV